MRQLERFNPYLIILHLLAIFILSYTLVIKSIFSSTDSVNTHMKQAGVYADVSNLIKAEVSARIDERFQERIILRALTDKLLDAIVTPEFVEQRSQRALTAATKVISQPLDIANNKVVVDTKEYKERATKELEERQLPDVVDPIVQNAITFVPDTLTLVDMTKRPNSILEFLTKAKIFYEKITVWNTIALVFGLITGVLLIIFNTANLRALFKSLAIAYLVVGALVFAGSFLFPYFIMTANEGPNFYLNALVSNAIYYLFAETRPSSLILLVLGGIFYLFFRWSFTDRMQRQIDTLLNRQTKSNKSSKKK